MNPETRLACRPGQRSMRNSLANGNTRTKKTGETGLVTISRFNDTELLVVLEEEGKKERQMLRGFVTNIAGRKFLNLQEIQGGYETRQWIFASYTTGDCSLTYRVVNDSLAPAGKTPVLSSGSVIRVDQK